MSTARRYRAPSQGLTQSIVFAILGLVVILVGWKFLAGKEVDDPPPLLEAQRLLRLGDAEGAAKALQTLDATLDADRSLDAAQRRKVRQRTEPIQSTIRRLREAGAEVERLLVDSGATGDQLEAQLRELARPRQDGDLRALAASHQLAALRTAGAGGPKAPGPTPTGEVATASPMAVAPSAMAASQPATERRPLSAADVLDLLGRVDRLVGEHQFRAAREILRQGVVEAGEAGEPLKTRLVRLDEECGRYCDQLIEQAEGLRKSGQYVVAVTQLDQESWRFPEGPSANRLTRMMEQLTADIRAHPSVTPLMPGDPDAWKRAAAQAVEREKDADYAEARDLYRRAAEGARGSDPTVARDFQRFAEEADLLDHVQRSIEAGINADASRWRGVPLDGGRRGDAVAADTIGITAQLGADRKQVPWRGLNADVLFELLPRAQPDARGWLGLGLLCLRAGQTERGERLLTKALEADPLVQGSIDAILSRLRGEPAPRGGYTFHQGRWVARADRDAELLSRQIDQRLGAILRIHDPRQREASFGQLIRALVSSPDALVTALNSRRAKEVEALTKAAAPLAHAHEQLAARHEELEQRRAFALELIFDEVKYFYPFNPPEVTPEKARLYWPVQQEVDRRVAAVREVWDDTKVVLRVPAALRSGVDALQWIDARLAELGERGEHEDAAIAWVLALPDETEVVSVRTYARTVKDKARLRDGKRLLRMNEILQGLLTAPERDELQLTNDYRVMMGRMPVALNRKLLAAARGHCEEMSKLGYFSHFSPTPGRRTPFDRMRIAGYNEGVSENIALNGSAPGAHQSWLHSAGHHRNILGAGHREFACGNTGNYFTQNFGVAAEYKTEPAWLEGKDTAVEKAQGKPKAKKGTGG